MIIGSSTQRKAVRRWNLCIGEPKITFHLLTLHLLSNDKISQAVSKTNKIETTFNVYVALSRWVSLS